MLKIEEKGVALQAIKISDPVANTTSMTDYFLEVTASGLRECCRNQNPIIKSMIAL